MFYTLLHILTILQCGDIGSMCTVRQARQVLHATQCYCWLLQVVELDAQGPLQLEYDEEWLAIMRATHHHLTLNRQQGPLPASCDLAGVLLRLNCLPTAATCAG